MEIRLLGGFHPVTERMPCSLEWQGLAWALVMVMGPGKKVMVHEGGSQGSQHQTGAQGSAPETALTDGVKLACEG